MIIRNNRELKQNDFKNEKELQKYFENNLDKILELKFIDTEFWIDNHTFRIDTLAFDEESKAFKIIEYKNVKNNSLIDQGFTYLKKMLENKEAFVLNYNLKTKSSYSMEDIDWSQSKIIFVSPTYSSYQLHATDFADLPFALYKVTRYEDNIVEIDKIEKNSKVKMSDTGTVIANDQIVKEIKVYTEEDHLSKATDETKNLYETLKNRILELDDIDMEFKKVYIAFKGRTNICDVEVFKNKLKLEINVKNGNLTDPLNITQDITEIGHWGNGDYRVEIINEEDIDNVIPLIKQSLKINKK